MFKILDIMSLRSIYIFFNKFGLRIGTLNPNISFSYMLVHKNGLKWTQIDEIEQMDRIGPNGNKVDQNGPNKNKWTD